MTPNGQGFGNPGTVVGERERKSLVGRSQRPGSDLEETPALIGGEVFATAGVDGLKIADLARHFPERNVRSGPSARRRLDLLELRKRCDSASQGVCGGSNRFMDFRAETAGRSFPTERYSAESH